jgi:glycosyltransferase involved in cell wall biosynthesis
MADRTASRTGSAPAFSIIMNVYNGERYLAEAIDSARAQTESDWELILWDDGSTDGSARLCADYRERDPRIRYFLAEDRGGIGRSRELAIRQARGAWLAFLDQDDLWTADKLAAQRRLIEADASGRLGLVYGRTETFDAAGRRRDFDRWHEFSALPEGDIFRELVRKPSFIALSSALLRKSAVDALGGIPEQVRYCPDFYLFLMVARDWRAACLQQVCCRYRLHDSNMSGTYRIQINEEILHIINLCSGRIDARILDRRHKIHHSLIGCAEISSLDTAAGGVARIVVRGSLLYLLYRPFLYLFRFIRRSLRTRS